MVKDNKIEKVSNILSDLRKLEKKSLEYLRSHKDLDEEKTYVLHETLDGLPQVIDIMDCMVVGNLQDMIDKNTLISLFQQNDVDNISEVVTLVNTDGELNGLYSIIQ